MNTASTCGCGSRTRWSGASDASASVHMGEPDLCYDTAKPSTACGQSDLRRELRELDRFRALADPRY
jgi:hypothetical protein